MGATLAFLGLSSIPFIALALLARRRSKRRYAAQKARMYDQLAEILGHDERNEA